MQGFRTVIPLFPNALQQLLAALPPSVQQKTKEIRLKTGQAIAFDLGNEVLYLTSCQGELSAVPDTALVCLPEWIAAIVDEACDYSLYTHQEELRWGYITTRSGCRIGIAGSAVVEGGSVKSYRNISSLCIRIAREHCGCAKALLPLLYRDGVIHSLLICGEPSSGKSSLLRDIACSLAEKAVAVSVVDERGELSNGSQTKGCDVLLYTPKAIGIQQAVRCLSPQAVILDELGHKAEIDAVMDGVYFGVPTIASVHCYEPRELLNRRALKDALCKGAFEYTVFLKGRSSAGKIASIYNTGEWLREMDRGDTGTVDSDRIRYRGEPSLATAGGSSGTVFPIDRYTF